VTDPIIALALEPVDFAAFGTLVVEYLASLPFPLDFQDTERELSELAEEYGPCRKGLGLLARSSEREQAVGCVGVRDLHDPSGKVGELKRMYVQPVARGKGVGRALCERAIAGARELGYEKLRLDSVAEMQAAAAIYEAAGFRQIPPYRLNPLPTARYYELTLGPAQAH
jgi:putative acetyltransferase